MNQLFEDDSENIRLRQKLNDVQAENDTLRAENGTLRAENVKLKDQSDPASAKKAANKLAYRMNEDQVRSLFGPTSSAALASAFFTEQGREAYMAVKRKAKAIGVEGIFFRDERDAQA